MNEKIKRQIALFLFFLLGVSFLTLFIPCVRSLCVSFSEFVLGRGLNSRIWNFRLMQYGTLGCFLCCFIGFRFFSGAVWKKNKKSISAFSEFIFFLLSAVLILLFASTTSPLYPFHSWGDSNTIFTVGRGVLNGKVIYRDLYDQKGPLLFFLHAVGAIVSKRTFLGIWFLQLISLASFLLISSKTLKLFDDCNARFLMPLVMAIVWTSKNYVLGDSAEEFCYVFLSYPLYLSFRLLKKKIYFSNLELILVGVCSGCVLWIKYTMCAFFVGWCFVPIYAYIKERKWKEILSCALFIFCGLVLATIPIFLYFFINTALSYLFESYFFNNMTIYGEKSSGMVFFFRIFERCMSAAKSNWRTALLLLIAFTALARRRERTIFIHVVLCLAFLCVGIFWGGAQAYYSFICGVFIPLCLVGFNQYGKIFIFEKRNAKILLSVMFFSACLSPYLYLVAEKKESIPQYVFADYMKEAGKTVKILNYGVMDEGFYMITGCEPTNKFFCRLNIGLKEMYEEQDRLLNQGIPDFVVTSKNGGIRHGNYEFIMSMSHLYRTYDTFYLYKRK